MESQVNQSIRNAELPVQAPVSQPPVQVPEKPKVNYLLFALGGVLLLILGFAGGYFIRGSMTTSPVNYSTATPTIEPTGQSTVSPSTTETYLIKQIGLQYTLPASLSKFGAMNTEIIDGEKGNQLCITFPRETSWLIKTVYAGGAQCSIVHFGFGTTSVDYEAGREYGFMDLQGYEKRNGKYYYANTEIPADVVNEIVNPNGVTILKVKGKKYDEPVPFVYEGSIGALINIANNPNYHGIALELNLTEGYTEQDFDKILASLKFVQ